MKNIHAAKAAQDLFWKRRAERTLGLLESRTPGLVSQLGRRWAEGARLVAGSLERGYPWPTNAGRAPAAALEALLVLCRERQREDPLRGMTLARRALELSRGSLVAYRPVSWILFANAARLRSMPRTCEAALLRARRRLGGEVDKGLFWRTLGLLRSGQGQIEEAFDLLEQARWCFEGAGYLHEAASCTALRCVLAIEWGRWPVDLELALPGALLDLDVEAQPGLAARAWLTWAWVLAVDGWEPRAREVLSRWPAPPLSGVEAAEAYLLEGRVWRRLQEPARATRSLHRATELFRAAGRRYEVVQAALALSRWEVALTGVRYQPGPFVFA